MKSVILTVQFIRFLVMISLIMNFSFLQPASRASIFMLYHSQRLLGGGFVRIDFSAAIQYDSFIEISHYQPFLPRDARIAHNADFKVKI